MNTVALTDSLYTVLPQVTLLYISPFSLSLSPLPPPPSPPIFSLQAKGHIFVGLHVKLVLGVVLTSSTG